MPAYNNSAIRASACSSVMPGLQWSIPPSPPKRNYRCGTLRLCETRSNQAMNSSRFLAVLFLICFAVTGSIAATNQLLPGLTYYPGKEKLTGKIAFLISHDDTEQTNYLKAASIYEIDLPN